jgi:hypothetical protein
MRSRRRAAQVKPITGEMTSERPMLRAWPQLTPSPNACPFVISEFAKPTPMIEPIRVWELEAGRPRYQVPTFQMMAERRSANTMAKPALEPMLITSSTGRRAMMP